MADAVAADAAPTMLSAVDLAMDRTGGPLSDGHAELAALVELARAAARRRGKGVGWWL